MHEMDVTHNSQHVPAAASSLTMLWLSNTGACRHQHSLSAVHPNKPNQSNKPLNTCNHCCTRVHARRHSSLNPPLCTCFWDKRMRHSRWGKALPLPAIVVGVSTYPNASKSSWDATCSAASSENRTMCLKTHTGEVFLRQGASTSVQAANRGVSHPCCQA